MFTELNADEIDILICFLREREDELQEEFESFGHGKEEASELIDTLINQYHEHIGREEVSNECSV